HLRRLDHIWKPVGFLLLTVYWFNPVMWLAYVLLCRDIELACDEKVILEFGSECKKPYSEALINCSVPRRAVSACPLAFGEVGVKGRIKNVLSYKKPAFWLIIAAVLLSVSLAVCFLTDPPKTTAQDIFNEDGYTVLSQEKYELTLAVEKAKLPEAIYTEKYDFEEGDVLAYSSQHTKIYLQSIQPANEGDDMLYFFFDCEYTLGDKGKMLYPYYKTGENASQGFGLASKTLRDNNTYYDNAVSVRGQGPGEQIVFYVDTEAVKAAEGALYIDVYLYETEYAKGSHTKINDDMYAVEYGEKQLTLDDVKELSKKGDALCSDDLEGYKYTETGSGIYICVYKIDDMFTLTVGYASGNKPLYARLSANDGSGDEVDIRYFDVESYITLHKDNPLVENLSGRINVYSVGYSEEAEKRFTHLAGIPEKAYMDSIHYLPVKHIDSKTEFDQFISDIEEYFSFDKTLNGSEPFADCLQVYDKSFFAENDLCLIYTGRSTSNCGYSVSPFKSNKTITVSLREFPNEADAGSTDGWLVAVGIPKSDIVGVERICAVLNGDSVTEPEAQMIEMYRADTGDIFFDPYVALMNNGRFTMSFSALSSYIGAGEYFTQDDKLILVCDDYGYKYVFTKTDLKLIYDESESDGPANYSELKDGMVFHKCYEHIITDSEDYH
ncbi:MAG: M56 family metallopeptidase, partial [Clostridia bacterium]|nr:M56 family metallopeptidase [Clostridia bacterium]